MTANHTPWSPASETFTDARSIMKWIEEMLADGGTHNLKITWVEAIDHNDGQKVCVALLGNGPSAERHAPLIAAAPDLLAACEFLAPFADDIVGGDAIESERLRMAHAAIAKARGGA